MTTSSKPRPGRGHAHALVKLSGLGRLADVLGPDFTLLTADSATGEDFGTAARALGIPLIVPDCDPDWFSHWGSAAILVRPDGFIAWAGDATKASAAKEILISATAR